MDEKASNIPGTKRTWEEYWIAYEESYERNKLKLSGSSEDIFKDATLQAHQETCTKLKIKKIKGLIPGPVDKAISEAMLKSRQDIIRYRQDFETAVQEVFDDVELEVPTFGILLDDLELEEDEELTPQTVPQSQAAPHLDEKLIRDISEKAAEIKKMPISYTDKLMAFKNAASLFVGSKKAEAQPAAKACIDQSFMEDFFKGEKLDIPTDNDVKAWQKVREYQKIFEGGFQLPNIHAQTLTEMKQLLFQKAEQVVPAKIKEIQEKEASPTEKLNVLRGIYWDYLQLYSVSDVVKGFIKEWVEDFIREQRFNYGDNAEEYLFKLNDFVQKYSPLGAEIVVQTFKIEEERVKHEVQEGYDREIKRLLDEDCPLFLKLENLVLYIQKQKKFDFLKNDQLKILGNSFLSDAKLEIGGTPLEKFLTLKQLLSFCDVGGLNKTKIEEALKAIHIDFSDEALLQQIKSIREDKKSPEEKLACLDVLLSLALKNRTDIPEKIQESFNDAVRTFSDETASKLVAYSRKMFAELDLDEFSKKFARPDSAPQKYATHLSSHVQRMIFQSVDANASVLAIKQWLYIANKCMEQGDYCSAHLIQNALSELAVKRVLESTTGKEQEIYAALKIIFVSQDYKQLGIAINESREKGVKPLVPSLYAAIILLGRNEASEGLAKGGANEVVMSPLRELQNEMNAVRDVHHDSTVQEFGEIFTDKTLLKLSEQVMPAKTPQQNLSSFEIMSNAEISSLKNFVLYAEAAELVSRQNKSKALDEIKELTPGKKSQIPGRQKDPTSSIAINEKIATVKELLKSAEAGKANLELLNDLVELIQQLELKLENRVHKKLEAEIDVMQKNIIMLKAFAKFHGIEIIPLKSLPGETSNVRTINDLMLETQIKVARYNLAEGADKLALRAILLSAIPTLAKLLSEEKGSDLTRREVIQGNIFAVSDLNTRLINDADVSELTVASESPSKKGFFAGWVERLFTRTEKTTLTQQAVEREPVSVAPASGDKSKKEEAVVVPIPDAVSVAPAASDKGKEEAVFVSLPQAFIPEFSDKIFGDSGPTWQQYWDLYDRAKNNAASKLEAHRVAINEIKAIELPKNNPYILDGLHHMAVALKESAKESGQNTYYRRHFMGVVAEAIKEGKIKLNTTYATQEGEAKSKAIHEHPDDIKMQPLTRTSPPETWEEESGEVNEFDEEAATSVLAKTPIEELAILNSNFYAGFTSEITSEKVRAFVAAHPADPAVQEFGQKYETIFNFLKQVEAQQGDPLTRAEAIGQLLMEDNGKGYKDIISFTSALNNISSTYSAELIEAPNPENKKEITQENQERQKLQQDLALPFQWVPKYVLHLPVLEKQGVDVSLAKTLFTQVANLANEASSIQSSQNIALDVLTPGKGSSKIPTVELRERAESLQPLLRGFNNLSGRDKEKARTEIYALLGDYAKKIIGKAGKALSETERVNIAGMLNNALALLSFIENKDSRYAEIESAFGHAVAGLTFGEDKVLKEKCEMVLLQFQGLKKEAPAPAAKTQTPPIVSTVEENSVGTKENCLEVIAKVSTNKAFRAFLESKINLPRKATFPTKEQLETFIKRVENGIQNNASFGNGQYTSMLGSKLGFHFHAKNEQIAAFVREVHPIQVDQEKKGKEMEEVVLPVQSEEDSDTALLKGLDLEPLQVVQANSGSDMQEVMGPKETCLKVIAEVSHNKAFREFLESKINAPGKATFPTKEQLETFIQSVEQGIQKNAGFGNGQYTSMLGSKLGFHFHAKSKQIAAFVREVHPIMEEVVVPEQSEEDSDAELLGSVTLQPLQVVEDKGKEEMQEVRQEEVAHEEAAEDLSTLKRMGSGVAIFVALLNLENPTERNYAAFKIPEQIKDLKSFRVNEIHVAYKELLDALQQAGKLTYELGETLIRERDSSISLLDKDPLIVIPFKSADHVRSILKSLLKNDTAKDLSEGLDNPDEPFYEVMARDYYPQTEEGVAPSKQALDAERAIGELDKKYRAEIHQESMSERILDFKAAASSDRELGFAQQEVAKKLTQYYVEQKASAGLKEDIDLLAQLCGQKFIELSQKDSLNRNEVEEITNILKSLKQLIYFAQDLRANPLYFPPVLQEIAGCDMVCMRNIDAKAGESIVGLLQDLVSSDRIKSSVLEENGKMLSVIDALEPTLPRDVFGEFTFKHALTSAYSVEGDKQSGGQVGMERAAAENKAVDQYYKAHTNDGSAQAKLVSSLIDSRSKLIYITPPLVKMKSKNRQPGETPEDTAATVLIGLRAVVTAASGYQHHNAKVAQHLTNYNLGQQLSRIVQTAGLEIGTGKTVTLSGDALLGIDPALCGTAGRIEIRYFAQGEENTIQLDDVLNRINYLCDAAQEITADAKIGMIREQCIEFARKNLSKIDVATGEAFSELAGNAKKMFLELQKDLVFVAYPGMSLPKAIKELDKHVKEISIREGRPTVIHVMADGMISANIPKFSEANPKSFPGTYRSSKEKGVTPNSALELTGYVDGQGNVDVKAAVSRSTSWSVLGLQGEERQKLSYYQAEAELKNLLSMMDFEDGATVNIHSMMLLTPVYRPSVESFALVKLFYAGETEQALNQLYSARMLDGKELVLADGRRVTPSINVTNASVKKPKRFMGLNEDAQESINNIGFAKFIKNQYESLKAAYPEHKKWLEDNCYRKPTPEIIKLEAQLKTAYAELLDALETPRGKAAKAKVAKLEAQLSKAYDELYKDVKAIWKNNPPAIPVQDKQFAYFADALKLYSSGEYVKKKTHAYLFVTAMTRANELAGVLNAKNCKTGKDRTKESIDQDNLALKHEHDTGLPLLSTSPDLRDYVSENLQTVREHGTGQEVIKYTVPGGLPVSMKDNEWEEKPERKTSMMSKCHKIRTSLRDIFNHWRKSIMRRSKVESEILSLEMAQSDNPRIPNMEKLDLIENPVLKVAMEETLNEKGIELSRSIEQEAAGINDLLPQGVTVMPDELLRKYKQFLEIVKDIPGMNDIRAKFIVAVMMQNKPLPVKEFNVTKESIARDDYEVLTHLSEEIKAEVVKVEEYIQHIHDAMGLLQNILSEDDEEMVALDSESERLIALRGEYKTYDAMISARKAEMKREVDARVISTTTLDTVSETVTITRPGVSAKEAKKEKVDEVRAYDPDTNEFKKIEPEHVQDARDLGAHLIEIKKSSISYTEPAGGVALDQAQLETIAKEMVKEAYDRFEPKNYDELKFEGSKALRDLAVKFMKEEIIKHAPVEEAVAVKQPKTTKPDSPDISHK